MNPFSILEDATVLGYLKSGTSLDADVVRARCTAFVSGAQSQRTLLRVIQIVGWAFIVLGIPLMLVIIGLPMVLIGLPMVFGTRWARKRLAQNIEVVERVYSQFAAATLRPATAGLNPLLKSVTTSMLL